MAKFTYSLSLCSKLEVIAQVEKVWIPFYHFSEIEKGMCHMHRTQGKSVDKLGYFSVIIQRTGDTYPHTKPTLPSVLLSK